MFSIIDPQIDCGHHFEVLQLVYGDQKYSSRDSLLITLDEFLSTHCTKNLRGITDPIRILVLGLSRLVSSFCYLYYFAPALLPTARKWKIVWWQIFIEYISAIDDKDLLFGYFCRNLIKRKRTECDNWANEEKTKRWHEKMLRVEQKSQIRDRGCIARPSGRRRRSI